MKRVAAMLFVVLGACLNGSAQKRFHFPVGLTYASGIHRAVDKLEDLYESAGIDFDEGVTIPVGLSISPYYEIAKGFSIGADLGPTSFIVVDEISSSGGDIDRDIDVSYIIPVGMHVRYTLFPDKTVSPYVRGGFKYPIGGGRNVGSTDIGPFGAVGVEFWRNKTVGLGLEVGYDGSRITIEDSDLDIGRRRLDFPGWTVSIQAVF